MFRIFSTVFCCFLASVSFAQIGFTGAYYTQSIPEWEAAVFGNRSNEQLLNTGYSAEIDFRVTPLENYRVEFFPTLTYNLTNTTTVPSNLGNGRPTDFVFSQVEFGIKTNIFILSLEADCDCPTFSREAGLLEKGFFVQIAPGISYFNGEIGGEFIDITNEANGLNFKLGLGVGLEIGLSDYLTITPLVKYNRYFNVEWEGLKDSLLRINGENFDGSNTSPINQFYGGIKIGILFNP